MPEAVAGELGMKRVISIITVFLVLSALGCQQRPDSESKPADKAAQATSTAPSIPQRPTNAELHAFKAYHHAVYMETTAKQAGGTNRLLHTKSLPTEGTDPVVTPALDHLYSKAVIDLTSGPVIVYLPEVEKDRYFSIHVTDQEHYTIYDEIHPSGKYAIVRDGAKDEIPDDAKVITSPGDYPHLFIRIQIKTPEDGPITKAIQEQITLTGTSKELTIGNPITFTIETHDIYPKNEGLLTSVVDFGPADYKRASAYLGFVAPKFSGNIGMFGPIDSKEPNSDDPEVRAGAIVGHLGLPAEHAFYAPYFANCNDEVLNGNKTEVFVFPYEPEDVELFWSVTRYSALTRNTLPGKNDIFNAYNTAPDEDGNITITFSAEDPEDGTYWMPVNADEPYYFVARYYKPDLDNLPQKPCN